VERLAGELEIGRHLVKLPRSRDRRFQLLPFLWEGQADRSTMSSGEVDRVGMHAIKPTEKVPCKLAFPRLFVEGRHY